MALNEHDHAIVVGISRYGTLRPELEGPEHDATAFANWLRDPEGGGLPPKNVKVILSSTYEANNKEAEALAFEPSMSRVTAEFGRLIGTTHVNKDTTPRVGRRLYIYLAGHGLTPKRDALTTTQHSSLAMANFVDESHPESVSGMMYANWFRESHSFDEILLFMDCCRDDWPEVLLPGILLPIVEKGRPHDVRTFYAWSTKWNSKAWEVPLGSPPQKRGVFTYALLEALTNGTPDASGRTTPRGIAGHIMRRVPELRDNDSSQGPQFLPEQPDDSIVLLDRPRAAAATTANVTVTFGDALAGKTATLVDQFGQEQTRVISAAPWPLLLKKGVHVITVEGKDHFVVVRRDGESLTEHVDA